MSGLPALPAAANLPPTLPQASAAAGNAAASVSFEAVLEAQLGVQSLQSLADPVLGGLAAQDADPQRAPAPKDTKTDDAPVADAAAAGLLFLPVTTAAFPVTSDPAAKPDQASAARTEVIAAPRPLPASLVESRAVQAEQRPESATEADLTAPTPTAASLADALQSLPAALPAGDRPAPAGGHLAQAVVVPPDSPPALPVQAAHVAETAAPAAHAEASIPGAVGDPRWGDAFSQRVVWMVGQELQSAEFRVEPPQLGPIEVRLSITNDQANLLFNAPHAVAREAIQTSLPRLQEMLLESGVALGNVSVGTGSRQDQTDFAFGRSAAQGAGTPAAASTTAGIEVAVRRGIGLVDLFA